LYKGVHVLDKNSLNNAVFISWNLPLKVFSAECDKILLTSFLKLKMAAGQKITNLLLLNNINISTSFDSFSRPP